VLYQLSFADLFVSQSSGRGKWCFTSFPSRIYLFHWNKWSCKLNLEGKVQREHFFKKQAMQHSFYSQYNNGVTFVTDSKLVAGGLDKPFILFAPIYRRGICQLQALTGE
jgi:hypothetical protein